ncbi:MAG TPA: antitoxin family protein [Pirellulaceae bacterium]|nr:antitoxin family protein [Pirellulaceae bacterium]
MLHDVDAVYENGVLRPLQPLLLSEHERVKLTVARGELEDWLDTEFMDACLADADPAITLEQVRASLGKIPGSMDDAIQEDRGRY